MENILYLTHRIPYPPNKGDKIRSFHILQYLAQHYRVHLGTFIDDEHDNRYIDELDVYTADKLVLNINPLKRKVYSLAGLLTGQAFSTEYYRNTEFKNWVKNKIERLSIRKIVLFSSPMAQFLEGIQVEGLHRVMDFVDVDSEKWLQYADKHHFFMKYLYKREGTKLRQFEQNIANQFEASLFVSEQEAALFRDNLAVENDRVHAMLNGVDTVFFDPTIPFVNPYPDDKKIIVFTGAMDYWANVEAVVWFANQVLPEILKKNPNVCFYIVGARPSDTVKDLAKNSNIKVTGSVKEIRPYVHFAHVAVAPLRVARGIQNKVLEAMAMKKFIVATPEAMEGIGSSSTVSVRTAAKHSGFADEVVEGLASEAVPSIDDCRDFVLTNFSWDSHLSKLSHLLEAANSNTAISAS